MDELDTIEGFISHKRTCNYQHIFQDITDCDCGLIQAKLAIETLRNKIMNDPELLAVFKRLANK